MWSFRSKNKVEDLRDGILAFFKFLSQAFGYAQHRVEGSTSRLAMSDVHFILVEALLVIK
jgi:hypothetical protein